MAPGWVTVMVMMRKRRGLAGPEDLRRTPQRQPLAGSARPRWRRGALPPDAPERSREHSRLRLRCGRAALCARRRPARRLRAGPRAARLGLCHGTEPRDAGPLPQHRPAHR